MQMRIGELKIGNTSGTLTIFTQGCNLKCINCKVPHFIEKDAFYLLEEPSKFIDKNIKKIIIRGGEPTIQEGLLDFLKFVKKQFPGVLIELHTNGTKPGVLNKIITNHLVDYIVVYIKHAFIKYNKITSFDNKIDWNCIYKSCLLVKKSGIAHEFIVNINKGLHEVSDIASLNLLLGSEVKLEFDKSFTAFEIDSFKSRL